MKQQKIHLTLFSVITHFVVVLCSTNKVCLYFPSSLSQRAHNLMKVTPLLSTRPFHLFSYDVMLVPGPADLKQRAAQPEKDLMSIRRLSSH